MVNLQRVCLLCMCIMVVGGPALAGKRGWNFAYVQSGLDGIFYARSIPKKRRGDAGTTTIYRVQKGPKDRVVDRYPWYASGGVVLGWSPIVGKVAVMRKGVVHSRGAKKQVQLSFYIGGKHLKSYTTAALVKMGAEVTHPRYSRYKWAVIRSLGCKQIPNTNHYVFAVWINATKTMTFDILTGKPWVAKRK